MFDEQTGHMRRFERLNDKTCIPERLIMRTMKQTKIIGLIRCFAWHCIAQAVMNGYAASALKIQHSRRHFFF